MPLYVPAVRPAVWSAEDNLLIASSFEGGDAAAAGLALAASGTIYGARLYIPKPALVTSIEYCVTIIGATLTAGQNFVALYQNNILLAASADQSANFIVLGVHSAALTATKNIKAGYVDVVVFSNGTTRPALAKTAAANAQINANLTTTAIRAFSANTGLTTAMPATLGTKTAYTNLFWFGIL